MTHAVHITYALQARILHIQVQMEIHTQIMSVTSGFIKLCIQAVFSIMVAAEVRLFLHVIQAITVLQYSLFIDIFSPPSELHINYEPEG
jgi:hypothetical protein